jgi:hypothetical protein
VVADRMVAVGRMAAGTTEGLTGSL